MTAVTTPAGAPAANSARTVVSWAQRSSWTIGLLGLLAILLVFTKIIQPSYGVAGIQGLGISILPLGFAAVAQAVAVIAGGIDLSIGSMMALTSVIAATLMDGQSAEYGLAVVIGVLILGLVLGAINGSLVVATRVPDIVVTLAMSFVWAGFALLVRAAPGGAASPWLMNLVIGPFGNPWIPKAAIVLSTSIGTPVPGPYTLESVAAVVLGGVSLAGGRGGVFGPIVAVVVLQIIQNDMTFLSFDPNYALVAQGVILIGVLILGSVLESRRARR